MQGLLATWTKMRIKCVESSSPLCTWIPWQLQRATARCICTNFHLSALSFLVTSAESTEWCRGEIRALIMSACLSPQFRRRRAPPRRRTISTSPLVFLSSNTTSTPASKNNETHKIGIIKVFCTTAMARSRQGTVRLLRARRLATATSRRCTSPAAASGATSNWLCSPLCGWRSRLVLPRAHKWAPWMRILALLQVILMTKSEKDSKMHQVSIPVGGASNSILF